MRSPDDLRHLLAHVHLVEQRVRRAVAARRATDPAPDDPYRGLYLTPESVDRILDAPSTPAQPVIPTPTAPGTRLHRLAERFGLGALDVELLLVAVAPELDARFERLYGYLNDDVTRRRPTAGLALELCGLPAAGPGRFLLSPTAPLVAGGLVEVHDDDRPALSRTLRVPDRVVAHLLGDDEPDVALRGLAVVRTGPAQTEDPVVERVAAAIGTGLVHLSGTDGDAAEIAVAGLARTGRGAVVLDVTALAELTATASATVLPALVREARLRGGGVVLGPVESLDPRRPERLALLRALIARATGVPLVVHGAHGWDPLWAARGPLVIGVPRPGTRQRAERWRRALTDAAGREPELGGAELAEVVAPLRLTAEQVRRAAAVAVALASLEERPVAADDVRAAVRAQNGAGLERLARRITPAVRRDDLVLPPRTRTQLAELITRARHRDQVLGRWGMRPGGGRGRGVLALFAGESGTGKTMSAEVVAAELGVELYVVDLSAVVDKYVGETEKNLERIFTEAAHVNGVLLFDEADAVFGKRSQVKDAHDRHANVESAYLLQRMESFDGIAVLTTNLRANLDEAFTRRLDVVADFPVPDAAGRLALWDRCLGTALPRGDDLDLEFCARRFELAGGSIRACAITAAYLAADTGRPVGMAQVMTAVVQEYRKLGRLLLESEFGPWLDGT
nr:ATP-binding protein [Umezawaea beigongshangensis]